MNCTRCDSRLSTNLSVQSYITALQSYITVLIYCTSGHCHQSHSKSGQSKVAHQKSYDERAGEMLMPVNQINQIYQLRRVCWNHFSFFSIIFSWFWFNLLPSAAITINISFLRAFEWCMSRGHLRLYTEILPLWHDSRRTFVTQSARTGLLGLNCLRFIPTWMFQLRLSYICSLMKVTEFANNASFVYSCNCSSMAGHRWFRFTFS